MEETVVYHPSHNCIVFDDVEIGLVDDLNVLKIYKGDTWYSYSSSLNKQEVEHLIKYLTELHSKMI